MSSNPILVQRTQSPPIEIYEEGEAPSRRETNERDAPIDPRMAFEAMNDFLESLQQQWLEYWDKNKAAVKPQLYAVEVQEEEGQDTLAKEQLEEPDEEQIAGGDHEHKEASDCEEGSQYDEGSLVEEYEVYLEVDDDDEPVTYFGAMHEEDESTTSKEVVSCAMMCVAYEDKDLSGEEYNSESGSDTLEVDEGSFYKDEPQEEKWECDTIEDHERHLKIVFEALEKADFYLEKEKCDLYAEKLNCLGHIIDAKGVHADRDKMS
ncbi:hypothetical protein PISMIDRAFT_10348 [Pisolithus microcarpus 441]|uniref:Uncharacterized protein n=1 Tax=Pisolithus microcarpus 441 TaxID=765257 RepID=A0A0C9ZX12_9AGAM|nr:hypothetical protein PISMIDRAFT_10348 [Pisolithus microcarpus 441]